MDLAQELMSRLYRFSQMKRKPSKVREMRNSELYFMSTLQDMLEENVAQNKHEGVMVSELMERMNVPFSAVSRSLKGLEEKNYVARSPSKEDRRVVKITLTKDGYASLEAEHKKLKEYMKGMVDYLGSNRVTQLIDILDDMYVYIGQEKEAEELHDKDC